MAIEREVFASLDQPIADILDLPASASDRIGEVTIGHLLSMQAGLQRTSGRYYGQWVTSDNWADYALSSRYTHDHYGYGWQMLYVFPDLKMTVVMTSDPQPPASPSFMQKQNALLDEFVIPAFPLPPAFSPQSSQAPH